MSETLSPATAQKNEKEPEKVPSAPSTNVFAVYGVEPEVQAYAMAKYSRSALSMRESLKEINDQKAEKFLNTFYFQYGHRSIADLAHIAFAIEKLSMIAAIILVDEQRWDGQERSTRYQDFKKSGYFTPDFGHDSAGAALYRETVKNLFGEYEAISEGMFRWLEDRTPKPEEMKQDQYERTLRARAFDISRYVLPLATNTSLGQIVNARTLETQISRLLASPFPEVRTLGALLKDAARNPSVNINQEKWAELVAEVRALNADLGERAAQTLLKDVRVSPTLVKYAEPSAYEIQTRDELQHAANEVMDGAVIAKAPLVDLLEDDPLEVELATTLLYQNSRYSYRQIRDKVSGLSGSRVHEIVDLGTKHRGRHDELLRAFSVGQRLKFDILMDVGGFRDMHRHRRCVQICQDFTAAHGFEIPEDLAAAGLGPRYEKVMKNAGEVSAKLAAGASDGAAHNAL